ncbi:MAG: efflux RND transporter periplasmic adaptor subunit, partial [Candidatus Eisenbacteria bacterium]|nr:efflux RND transporter periplasmic adaptor subunit [Candidatus Eisenbacteria bacterium]
IGRVQNLAVVEGQAVGAGDLLLVLDDERYRSILSGMEAQVKAAEAELELSTANLALTRQNLARQEKLFAEKLVSDETMQSIRTQGRVDEARVSAAREALRQRRSALDEARKNLEETVFRSPIDGIVTAVNVEQGENVITGTMNNPGTVILTVADLDTMEVEAEVDETDVVRIAPGLSAKVKVDAWEDSALVGLVRAVGMSGRKGSQSQQAQGTNFKVEVRIVDPPAGLRPGMSADIEVLTGERDSAVVVPIQSLTAQPERVWKRWLEARDRPRGGKRSREAQEPDTAPAAVGENLVDGIFLHRDGKAIFTPVTLGLRGDTHVEILGAVQPGDEVVTGPYRSLRNLKDGDAIRREKAKKSSRNGATT